MVPANEFIPWVDDIESEGPRVVVEISSIALELEDATFPLRPLVLPLDGVREKLCLRGYRSIQLRQFPLAFLGLACWLHAEPNVAGTDRISVGVNDRLCEASHVYTVESGEHDDI